MVNSMPPMNLSPEATPWGREMQSVVAAQQAKIDQLASNLANTMSTLNAALTVLGDISGLNPSTITIDMSQVITGNLDQSRVTGTWSKSVDTTGSVTADGTGTFDTGVNSVGAYNQSVTGSGSYRAAYINQNGVLGYVPSSRYTKQDIETAEISLDAMRALRIVFFRYIADVQGASDAKIQIGLIAEEVEDLGFGWLVDYGDDGKPLALNDRFIPFMALLLAQEAHSRIDSISESEVE